MSTIEMNRKFMQCPDFSKKMLESDQQKEVPFPPRSKEVTGELITLPPFDGVLTHSSYEHLLDIRRSERAYVDEPISQEQLAFLLWSIQGIQHFRGANDYITLRPVPSGGARHPFELYIAVRNVTDLKPGFYRYAPLKDACEKRVSIEFWGEFSVNYEEQMKNMLVGQTWGAHASIVLFFSCIPYRAEWRYVDMAHRVVLIDLGHVGQNAMLSASALGLGSCCIAAYDQALCDEAFGFNGIDEYTVYAIPVGVLKAQ